jgi:hypothetical protein
MADVIKSLGIDHVACNPGNLFRGLHPPDASVFTFGDYHTMSRVAKACQHSVARGAGCEPQAEESRSAFVCVGGASDRSCHGIRSQRPAV